MRHSRPQRLYYDFSPFYFLAQDTGQIPTISRQYFQKGTQL